MPQFNCAIVEVCVCAKIDDEFKFLILKRSQTVKLYPGQWQIITGHLLNDEKLQHAALRELKEETGFTPIKFWILPHTNTFIDAANDVVNVTAIFAAEVELIEKIKLSNEHEKYLWVNIEEANKYLVWPGQVKAIEVLKNYILSEKETNKLSQINL
ncbi:MAG: NUDIX domain-containing protein [Bacteroidetes bacterium]|nr:NUDIX domain-containing protein [Bacteroidota bacterium]